MGFVGKMVGALPNKTAVFQRLIFVGMPLTFLGIGAGLVTTQGLLLYLVGSALSAIAIHQIRKAK